MKPNLKPGKSYWGKQSFGGYPGVKFTASKIVEYIPIKPIYVEPFAGLGRTAKLITSEKMILNDMSNYAVNYLRVHFKNALIKQEDFMKCMMKHDSEDTIMFIDPPWVTNTYSENDLCFCDRKGSEYYDQIIDILPKLKSDWILASNVDGVGSKRMNKTDYPMIEVKSDKKVIFGLHARTKLMIVVLFCVL